MAFAETYSLDELASWAGQQAKDVDNTDFTKPLKICRLLIDADTKQNFAGSHDPNGAPWLPLKHRQGRPLRDKGLLMAASTTGLVETMTRQTLVLTNNLEYAGAHQRGVTIRRPERKRPYPLTPWVFEVDGYTVFTRKIRAHDIKIPARPFLGVGERLADKMARAFAEFFAGTL